MLKLELKTADQEHLEQLLSYVIENEEDNFIEELPNYLDNDVDCCEHIETEAKETPWDFDKDFEHIYTRACALRKAVFPNG